MTLCLGLPRWVSTKRITILDFAEADTMVWQWHQLNHMQAICTSLKKITTPSPHQSDFDGPDALPDTQPTASEHWRQQIYWFFLLCRYRYWFSHMKCSNEAKLHLCNNKVQRAICCATVQFAVQQIHNKSHKISLTIKHCISISLVMPPQQRTWQTDTFG